jgi:membrane carboxypeptidase/penicillin-binding protein
MINLGPTSDIIVAGLLAVSQLIVPVPEQAAREAAQKVAARNSCALLQTKKNEFNGKKCEEMRANRRQFRDECQNTESEISTLETQCVTDATVGRTLNFKPKPLTEYFKYTNAQLVDELNVICNSLQDRVFLEPEQWMAGETSNRDDLSSKLVMLQNPELQKVFSSILVEAAEGKFEAGAASNVITALCHWKVDRAKVAAEIDFTGGLKYLNELIAELPRVDQLPHLPEASFVYDKNDHRIGEIFDREFIERNGKRYVGKTSRRRNVEPEQVPPMLMNAFMAIEDKRFREHNGFDFEAVKRLVYGGTQGSTQGGSTFTMQLVKNAFFHDDVENERAAGKRTLRRKLKEILMLPQIEAAYSKEQILTYYLNLISLTSNAQGVMMAAMDLFNKDELSQLTLGEMATLAALPKGTSMYNPWRYPERATMRRNLVLDAMADQGYISAADRDKAKAETLNIADPTSLDQARIFSRYFTGHITSSFGSVKKKNARDPRWALGGFDIKTSFDLELQKSVTRALQEKLLAYEKGNGRYKWTPWIDDNTGLNMNVAARAAAPGVVLDDIFENLRAAHPYPETNWTVALKMPKLNAWQLEEGKTAPVAAGDAGIFRSLKAYDAVTLARGEDGVLRLAAPPKVQGGVVVLDNETGEVLALSGGFTAGPFGKNAQNNRVTRSVREPGSTIKLMTYLYALNHGLEPNTYLNGGSVRLPRIPNCPYEWHPGNYGGGGGGATTMRNALAKSMNVSVVNMFAKLAGFPDGGNLAGVDPAGKQALADTLYNIYDLAVAFGAYPSREYLAERRLQQPCFPFILGGVETTPLNMVQMYAAVGNGGLKREAIFLRQIFKGRTPLIVDHTDELRAQVMRYRAAVKNGFALAPEAFGAIPGVTAGSVAQLRALTQNNLRNGTASRIKRWADLIGGKTGTTNNSKDVWFSGYTGKLAITVWVGYDQSAKDQLGSATGGSLALPIFEAVMEDYYKAHPEEMQNFLPDPLDVPELAKVSVDAGNGRILCGGGGGIEEYIKKSWLKANPRLACGPVEKEPVRQRRKR